jgi:hypothetical protein
MTLSIKVAATRRQFFGVGDALDAKRQIGQVAERLMAADCKSAAPCGLRRFESSPVHKRRALSQARKAKLVLPGLAHVAQMVERVLGKDEVTSSILVVGSGSVG